MNKKPFIGNPGFDTNDAWLQHIPAPPRIVASAVFIMHRSPKPRATLNALKRAPVLNLSEENGKARAAVGTGSTITPDGKTITFPESSPLRLGPDGKRMWSAP